MKPDSIRERVDALDWQAFEADLDTRGYAVTPPLMLDHSAEGYNCLHQDVYGDPAFPLQVAGNRGDYRVKVGHGVSRIRSGHRRTLGIIFHDAR